MIKGIKDSILAVIIYMVIFVVSMLAVLGFCAFIYRL